MSKRFLSKLIIISSPRHLIWGLVGSGFMKKILGIMVLGLLISGCSTPESSSLKPVVNSDIREIALMPMGSNKYSLLIRGNVFSKQADLRKQFSQEVDGVCGNNFEILEISTSEITDGQYKKPIIEGNFVCK